jgi:hypothetical protein
MKKDINRGATKKQKPAVAWLRRILHKKQEQRISEEPKQESSSSQPSQPSQLETQKHPIANHNPYPNSISDPTLVVTPSEPVTSTCSMTSQHIDDDAVAAADKEMEERANRAKELLSNRYRGLKSQQEGRQTRKVQLERQMVGMPEQKKHELRKVLEQEENLIQKETRKKITVADFESLALVGRGAFGEVRLVRRKGKKDDPQTGQIFALKSMKKEMMIVKNQVHHVKAEQDALSKADDSNRWLTVLHCSFFDESHLYMVMVR